jgi:putative ABC transport system permease protein
MILLRLISWPYVRKHALRSVLTLAGIGIGVAVFVAMRAANQAVFQAFQQTVQRVAGRTELQVTAGGPGFDEEILERVQSMTEVAVAAPVIEAVAATGLPGQGNLLILGVDMTGDRSLREYALERGEDAVVDDPLVFLAQPDSLIVTSDFAARNHLNVNSRVPLETADGPRNFVVRGVLGGGGLTSAFGGNLAIMDIYAAQHVFGRGRTFDRIDLALTPGVALADGQQAVSALLGPGFQVQTPASRGQGFQSLLRIYDLMLNFSSAFALVIGMFIIYNSFSIAVTQRRAEIGILRALGASRRQIAQLFVGESAVGGLVGSTLGVLAGYVSAGATARVLDRVLEGVWGVSQGAPAITPSLPLALAAIAVGTGTSIVAALLPARSAARIDPVKALQKGRAQLLSDAESRARLVAAALLGPLGAVFVLATSSLPLFYLGYLGLILSALLLTPALSVLLVRLLRPVLGWLRPVEGALAADSLIGAPRRTSTTVAALMLALTLVVGLGGLAQASFANISEWASNALNADFFVTASPTLTARDYRFPDSMTSDLEAVPGVREVQRMRQGRVDLGGSPVLIMATDVGKLAATSPRRPLEGRTDEMYKATAEGRGVIASENFASLRKLHVGAVVDLPSPTGLVRLPLVGVVRDYADQQGSLMLDLSLYREHWRDDAVDFFRVYVAPGADRAAVRTAVLTRFSSDRRLFVLSSADVRQYVMGVANQFFGITRIQIWVAILVAILGIVNSLTVAIADRRRELGVFQAVGGLRGQVRRTIWMEAGTIGLVSLIMGLGLGAVHLYCSLEMSSRAYPGLRFDYMYPYSVALLLVPVILGAALLSAVGPAESAVRGSLVEALEYE